jgi:hypothetical protein
MEYWKNGIMVNSLIGAPEQHHGIMEYWKNGILE